MKDLKMDIARKIIMMSFFILMSSHLSVGSHDVIIQSKAPGVAESLTTTCIPYGFACNDGKPCCASKPCAYGVCGGADAIAMDCAILLILCCCISFASETDEFASSDRAATTQNRMMEPGVVYKLPAAA